jgi:hypothetical protein
LISRLGKEAVKLITGYTAAEEAWAELDAEYGNKQVAVITALQKMLDTRPHGEHHEVVRSVAQAVRACRTSLKAVNAEANLFSDPSVIGVLVSKMPPSSQERWDARCPAEAEDEDPVEHNKAVREVFVTWIEEENRMATIAKNRRLACEMRQGSRSNPQKTGASNKPSEVTEAIAVDTFLAHGTAGGSTKVVNKDASGGGEAGTAGWKQKLGTKEEASKEKEARETAMGPCPACKGRHTYTRKLVWGSMEWPSSRLDQCSSFKALSPAARATMLEGASGCNKCLSWEHVPKRCFFKKEVECPETVSGGEKCGRSHHALLHGSANVYCESFCLSAVSKEGSRDDLFPGRAGDLLKRGTSGALFEFVRAPIVNPVNAQEEEAIVFVDGGSNVNFIRMDLARSLGLKGVKTTIQLKVVDSEYRAKETEVFQIEVRSRDGGLHAMECIGVEDITEAHEVGDKAELRRVFPEATEEALERPVGMAGVLLSMTEKHLHAGGGRRVGRLALQKTPLGCGEVLTGVGAFGASKWSRLSGECRSLQGAEASLPAQGSVFHVIEKQSSEPDFCSGGSWTVHLPLSVTPVRTVYSVSGEEDSHRKTGRC